MDYQFPFSNFLNLLRLLNHDSAPGTVTELSLQKEGRLSKIHKKLCKRKAAI